MSTVSSLERRTSCQKPNAADRRSPEAAPPSFLLSIVDLTRCCCSQENYDAWIALHGFPLGSAGIAAYLARAAQVLKAESEAASFRQEPFDEWSARERFADILMSSGPLSPKELQAAARTSLSEARTGTASVRPCHL
jgi:hypothetical protein